VFLFSFVYSSDCAYKLSLDNNQLNHVKKQHFQDPILGVFASVGSRCYNFYHQSSLEDTSKNKDTEDTKTVPFCFVFT
jgi:hypothetical protein